MLCPKPAFSLFAVPSARWAWILILSCLTLDRAAADDVTYRYFRFSPTSLRGGAGAGSVQLASFNILHQGASLITGATSASNPGGNNPPAEGVANLIDGNANTKWLDFNVLPFVLDFGAAVTADTYSFTTANDAIERDPTGWRVEGSLDNTNWALIDVRVNYATSTSRFTTEFFTFSTTFLPGINNFSSDNNIILNGNATTLRWQTSNANTVILNGFGMVPASGSQVVNPGSTTTYTITATNPDGFSHLDVTVTVVAGAVETYRYYRFTALEMRNPDNVTVQLAEFTLFNGGVQLNPTSASNPGGNNPVGEGPANLIDGNTATKWLDRNSAPVVFDLGAPTAMTGYTITTANDFSSRDPVTWLMEGSDNQATWELIDHVIDFPTTDSRFAESSFIPVAGSSLIPYIQSFTANTSLVDHGGTVNLSWVSWGGNSWVVNGVSNPLSGDLGTVTSDPLAAPMTFVLTVTTVDGISRTRSVNVDVSTPPTLRILQYSVDSDTGQINLTWASSAAHSYQVTSSTDLVSWSTIRAGIAGAAGGEETSTVASFPVGAGYRVFRVGEE